MCRSVLFWDCVFHTYVQTISKMDWQTISYAKQTEVPRQVSICFLNLHKDWFLRNHFQVKGGGRTRNLFQDEVGSTVPTDLLQICRNFRSLRTDGGNHLQDGESPGSPDYGSWRSLVAYRSSPLSTPVCIKVSNTTSTRVSWIISSLKVNMSTHRVPHSMYCHH